MQLQRVTTSTRWLPEIDGLRCVAITAVLLVHVLDTMVSRSAVGQAQGLQHPHFLTAVNHLSRGVQLFFVISGFILAQPFLRHYIDGGKPVRLREFYLRRVTRLEPPYLLSLVLYAAGFVLFRGESVHSVLAAFGAHAFYLTQVLNGHIQVLNFVTWSLEVEVQFYLLTPVLALLFRVRPTVLRRAVLIVCILVCNARDWSALIGYRSILPLSLAYFLVGFLLADLRITARPALRHPVWDLVTLLVWPAILLLPSGRWLGFQLSLLLFSGVVAALSGPLVRRVLGWKPIAIIGGACYSIYLLHMLIFSTLFPATRRVLTPSHFWVNVASQVLLLIPAAIAVSMVYYVLIERPCMDPHWPGKVLRRLRGERQVNSMVTD